MKSCIGQGFEIQGVVTKMGSWGNGLYQNDLAEDLKEGYKAMFEDGKEAHEIESSLLQEYQDSLHDPEEAFMFWLVLADTQWKHGVLSIRVKEKALSCIEYFHDCTDRQSNEKFPPKNWKKSLEALQARLLSPQPPVKKPVKRRSYQCQWKIGDVYAYQLDSDLAKEKGLYGRYFLIQKIDEGSWYPKHIVPIVYVKITKSSHLPVNIEEYNELEYVQTSFFRFEMRFCPIDMRRPREDIAEKSKKSYPVDEYGFLPVYRLKLLNTSKKAIPSKLIYIGNLPNAIPPQKEYIPYSEWNINNISWKNHDTTFESELINRYYSHNLRQCEVYKKR